MEHDAQASGVASLSAASEVGSLTVQQKLKRAREALMLANKFLQEEASCDDKMRHLAVVSRIVAALEATE
jgi:hypothetical protein